jgi:hypothetical protein
MLPAKPAICIAPTSDGFEVYLAAAIVKHLKSEFFHK